MRAIRCYVPDAITLEREFALPDNVVAHVVRVLRLGVGDELQIFNGDGQIYHARICSQDKRGVYVEADTATQQSVESPLSIVLVQAVSRGDRMDYTVQKAVELGVTAIIPITSERCGVQLDAMRWRKKQEHWQSIVVSACEQSGRNIVPLVHDVQKIEIALSSLTSAHRFTLDPEAHDSFASIKLNGDVALLAGPEGGFSESDLLIAKNCGFVGVKMGPRILRTETAALAAISALQVLHGDFR